MKTRRVFQRRSPRARAPFGLALLARLALAAAPEVAADPLVTARPHAFTLGTSAGFATSREVHPTGSRHAPALPAPELASVVWKRQIPGGVGCNVIVDAAGQIFVAGPGRVTQLAPDGALSYSQPESFAPPVAAALLADGTRAVLTREGRVLGWWPSGALAFELELAVAGANSASSLLPLPDGGALASVGPWLFEIDATRAVRSHAALASAIQHTLLAGARPIVIDDQGRVFEWNPREPLRAIGAFGSPVVASAIGDGALIASSSRRALSSLNTSDGSVRDIARLDAPGVAPLLGRLAPRRWVLMRHDGSWFVSEPNVASPAHAGRAEAGALSELDLLVDAGGTVAWWAAEAPLHVETASGVGRELPDVRCTAPVSLVPAGRERLVAACGSGLIWLIGPASADPDAPSADPDAPSADPGAGARAPDQ